MDDNAVVQVAEQAAEAVATNATANVPAVDTGLDTGHKVLFYVLLGLISVTVIGVPVAIILWRRSAKKCKQLEEELNKLKNPETTTAEAAPAESTAEAKQDESKAEEKPEDKKKK